MDARSEKLSAPALRRPVWILSSAECGSTGLDVTPYVRDRKSIKLMAKQDGLALTAAAEAVRASGLTPEELRSETGIYLTVGTLPFEETHLRILGDNSVADGRFDMRRFSTEGYSSMSPMLTFKCLPNMPLFHISYNLGIQGPYFITYPGPSQFFTAFEQALTDLEQGRCRFALVGAVADQENFLVRNHTRRVGLRSDASLRDAASVMILTLEERPGVEGRIDSFRQTYRPVDPFARRLPTPTRPFETYAGAAEPMLVLRRALDEAESAIAFRYEDGVEAEIRLGIP